MRNSLVRVALIFLVSLFLSNASFGVVKYYQSNKINSDGSVTFSITYSTSTDAVTKGNNLIGNLPFIAKSIREDFSFPGAEIIKAVSYKDPQNASNTAVTVEIKATDFSKINTAKGFAGVVAKIMSTDTGLVFSWFLPTDYMITNSIDTYQFVVNSDPEIKSTNGTMKDNEIRWFVFSDKADPRGYLFNTTVKSDVKINTTNDKTEKTNTSDKSEPKKDGGCGLFGFEFPILLLGGLVLSGKLRKKK